MEVLEVGNCFIELQMRKFVWFFGRCFELESCEERERESERAGREGGKEGGAGGGKEIRGSGKNCLQSGKNRIIILSLDMTITVFLEWGYGNACGELATRFGGACCCSCFFFFVYTLTFSVLLLPALLASESGKEQWPRRGLWQTHGIGEKILISRRLSMPTFLLVCKLTPSVHRRARARVVICSLSRVCMYFKKLQNDESFWLMTMMIAVIFLLHLSQDHIRVHCFISVGQDCRSLHHRCCFLLGISRAWILWCFFLITNSAIVQISRRHFGTNWRGTTWSRSPFVQPRSLTPC